MKKQRMTIGLDEDLYYALKAQNTNTSQLLNDLARGYLFDSDEPEDSQHRQLIKERDDLDIKIRDSQTRRAQVASKISNIEQRRAEENKKQKKSREERFGRIRYGTHETIIQKGGSAK